MRWFRDNIGQGSWLALLALVINLGLSFGHVHAIEAKCAAHGLIAQVAPAASHHKQMPGHPDGQADYLCPICTAATAMASPLASAPPVPRIEFVGFAVDRPIESILAIAEPPTASFQSRGPPIS
jgi:hypothetical protein